MRDATLPVSEAKLFAPSEAQSSYALIRLAFSEPWTRHCMEMSTVLHSQTELGADSNCFSYDNVACCSGDSVEFTNSDDHVDRPTTTGSVVDVAPESANNTTSGGSAGDEGDAGDDQGTYHTVRSLILILALSLHHFFEGISVGLQRSVSGVFTLLIALLCHETIISFSLGLQFVKSSYSRRLHYVTAFLCSIIEPIGVAVGTLLARLRPEMLDIGLVLKTKANPNSDSDSSDSVNPFIQCANPSPDSRI